MRCNNIKFSRHALIQMFSRAISKEHVVKVIKNGEIITNYPDDKPYPSALLLGFAGNKPLHIVVGFDESDLTCIIITAYKPDLKIWKSDFKTRRKG